MSPPIDPRANKTITFTKVDEATLFVECNEQIGREMSNFFSVYAPKLL